MFIITEFILQNSTELCFKMLVYCCYTATANKPWMNENRIHTEWYAKKKKLIESPAFFIHQQLRSVIQMPIRCCYAFISSSIMQTSYNWCGIAALYSFPIEFSQLLYNCYTVIIAFSYHHSTVYTTKEHRIMLPNVLILLLYRNCYTVIITIPRS